jgi:mRNA-degrading endonuclease RelE of RelBE toxin-antitoxin system
MRKVIITDECLEYIDSQNDRVVRKFFELVEVLTQVQVVHQLFVKKLQNCEFYELRVRAGNEYRVIIFSVDHEDFNQCTKVICLWPFMKKATKDYSKAINKARTIHENYKIEE